MLISRIYIAPSTTHSCRQGARENPARDPASCGDGDYKVLGHSAKGIEHIPVEGPVIIAPSHGAWLDPVHNALGVPRPIRFMANEKVLKPLFKTPLTTAGAFPVKHGDAASGMASARVLPLLAIRN